MKIGVIVPLKSYKEEFKKLRELGIYVCQFNTWNSSEELTEELALDVKAEAEKQGIEISAVWRGWSGPAAWNFTEGPITLGLVPEEYRADRIYDLKVGSDFAKYGIELTDSIIAVLLPVTASPVLLQEYS